MDVLIIGNGIAGVTAAISLRKISDCKITIISAETEYFFSRTALMYIYMGHMRYEDTKPYENGYWKQQKINLLQSEVKQVLTETKQVELADKSRIAYDKLIIASGSTPVFYGWKGQEGKGVQELYTYQDLEKLTKMTPNIKKAVVVGGGLIGIELAEMLQSKNIEVHFLIREKNYWENVLPTEESEMISAHVAKHHIHLLPNTELKEIILDENTQQVKAIIYNDNQKIDCDFVGICTGVRPNVDWLKKQPTAHSIIINKGIVANQYLQTSDENVYAIGDCVELSAPSEGRKSIEAIWYIARAMGETVAHNILGKNISYQPRLWFNSAKFLDIEYQVYGNVPAATATVQYDSLFWRHKDKEKSIRIVYNRENQQVLGFNLMGIRYRHEVCEKWIVENTKLEQVLAHLSLANFDPEFFTEYEPELLKMYNQQFGKNIQLQHKRGLKAAWQFIKNKLKVK
jgi:NAD(P)H-nitrite reductase large subunit